MYIFAKDTKHNKQDSISCLCKEKRNINILTICIIILLMLDRQVSNVQQLISVVQAEILVRMMELLNYI